MSGSTPTDGNNTLVGSDGNDFIDLLGGSDSYLGLGGNDTILGGDGADTIYGDAGDDSISGGNDDDRLFGGLGNDTIDAGAGNSDRIRYDDLDSLSPVTVVIENSGSSSGFNRATVSTAAQGTDSIMGFEILTTTTGNDHITVNSVATANALLHVFANRGNDTIIFNTTDNSVFADYLHGQTEGGVTVDLLAGTAVDPFGTDSLVGARNINGSDRDDIFLGSDFNDRFRGRGGNDYFDGRGGSDMADYSYLTAASQGISVNLAAERASDGSNGTDTLISIEQVRGGAGNDTIIGSSADNVIRGNAGSDSLDGSTGTGDVVDYSLNSFGVSVNLLAGRGVDGPTSTDTLVGFEQIYGSAFDDTLIADAAEVNVLRGNAGNDLLDGGAGGLDVADYGTGVTSGGVSVNLAAGIATGAGIGTDTLIGIERAFGSSFGDTLIGSNVTNRFRGLGGNDSMDGGLGSDWVEYNSSSVTAGVTVNLTTGTASDGFGGTDSFTSFENVIGSSRADHITGIALGGTGIGRLRGGAGSDTLVGLAGQLILADYADQTVGLSVNLASGSVNDGLGGVDQLVNIRGAFMFGSFADTLLGTGENEWFFPSGGNDTVVGGNGFDIIHYDGNPTGGVSVNLAAGLANDGDGGTDRFTGIEGVVGGYASDTIIGDSQGNLINPNVGADSVDAGTGQDTISYSLGFSPGSQVYTSNEAQDQLPFTGVTIDLALGRATDQAGATDTILNFEAAIGSTQNDSILGSNSSDVLDGGEGNDNINGGNGNDTINGGSGSDQLRGGDGSDSLIGSDGADTLSGSSGNDLLDGGNGSDVAAYDSNSSSQAVSVDLVAGRANDGVGGADTLSGIEYVWGGAGNDTIIGGTGADSFWGNSGNDTLVGGNGADTLDGGSGNDTITGGDGSDRIFGATGSDSIDAGAGTGDIISFNHTSAQAVSATISAIGGSAGSNYAEVRTASQGNDTIINFENIQGSFENDGFTINSAATDNALLFVFSSIGADTIAVNVASNAVMADYNTITGSTNFTRGVIVDLLAGTADDGRGGIDSLIGVRGVSGSSFGDTILGSAFNDRFREQGGSDSINGRDGFDMLDYSGNSASQSVSVNLAAERASDGREGTDTVISMEYVRSGSGNDTLIGNSADNEFRGGNGADILDGGASGFDIADYANNTSAQAISVNLTTGRASDGFGFNDTLVSIEYVRGGSGNDTMIGSAANERFRGNAGNDTIDGGDGTEDILDLSQTTQSVSANLVTGLANDGLDGADSFTNIEVVYSGTANDILLGSDRNEIFDGGMGGDLIDGGLGYDRVRYWNVSGRNSAITRGVSVDLAAERATDGWGGQDTLIGIERVTATDFADTLLGDNVGNRFNGRAGNDSIDGGLSIDWLEYLDGDATAGVTVNLTTGTASDGRGGTDIFTSIENVSGQDFADHLTGIAQLGRSTSRLRGGGGNDTLVGIANEFVTADYTDQTMGLSVNLASGSVNDGLGGVDQLINIRGAIMLGSFADTIIGTAGNDWLSPGGGNDTISGGDGLDIISYDGNPTSGVSVNLAAGRASDGDGGTDSLNGVEGVWVSYSNDTVVGDGQGNLIGLGAGADSADAAAGQDTISYSLGFSPNTSVYVFNEAQNQLSFTGVTIDLAAGRATDFAGATDTILNFEAAIGSTMHDSILGSNGNDVLDGAEGNDAINGGGGGDTIYAGAGDDVVLVGNVTLAEINALFGP